MLAEKKVAEDNTSNLLVDYSGLITECEPLSANVKTLQGALFELQISFDVSKKEFCGKEKSWVAEKESLLAKLEDVEA